MSASTLLARFRLALIFLASLLGLRYLYWRAFQTLNTENTLGITLSVVLYAAEIYGFLAIIFFFLQVMRPTNRTAIAPDREALPTVDIFVTIYDESIDILYRTLVGSLAIDYPVDRRKVYVLDDGNRREVKDLAERLGCVYLARETNDHAKAGNLNHGLSRSSGEFVMILDCDHVPVRTFLSETLGFFSDPKVAFVQTPHHFYNPDTYQRNLRLERQIVNEQDLFFQIVQPGRDGFNSAFFAGTGGVFRRSALEGIGGFQVATLTEDLHTSLVLHAKGFRSIYLNKILAAGLSPESFRSYLRQRQRWTRGHMQLLLMSNPLWKRGLTFMQRIHYFASIFYFLHGIPRVIFLVAPLAYLLLGVPPLVAHVPTLLFYYLPYYFVAVFAFDLASEKARNPFWSELYETASCFSLSWAAVETLFLKQKKKPFHVTPKGQRFEQMRLDRASVLPHFVVGVLLTVGLVVGGYQLWNGRGNLDATMLSTFWTGYNLLLIWVGIFAAWERPQRRSSPRISREIPCQLRFNGVTVTGRTADISEGGLSLVPDQVSALPARLRVSLDGAQGERVELDGMVVRDDFFPSGQSSVGVHFVDLGEAQRQGLLRQIYSGPESWQIPMTSGGWRSLVLLATAAGRSLKREKALRRLSPRVRRRVQCYIVSADKVFKGVTEDISSGGACLRFEAKKGFTNRLASKVLIQFCNGGQPLSSVRGAIIRYEERPGRMFVCAVQFLPENALDPNLWRDASKEVRT